MKVSRTELLGGAAILLYIVFFSHSPPPQLRGLLSNTFVSIAVLAALAYVTLYQSRTLGVLAILAFLLTMTRVTEHLESGPVTPSGTSGTPPTNTPPPPPPPASSTHMDASGNIVDASGAIVTPAHTDTDYNPQVTLQSSPGVTAAATSTPAPNVAGQQLMEGSSYKCDSGPAVFGYVGGVLRMYPTPEVAASWDPNWASAKQIDCSKIQTGQALEKKTSAPATTSPAPVMSCNIESFASF